MATADYTTKPFTDWTLADAQAAVAAAIAATPGTDAYAANLAFVEQHDHWQNGKRWVGPGRDASGNLPVTTAERIKQQFTPCDVIEEVLDNLVNAVLEREANVSFVPRVPAPAGSEAETTQRERAAAMREAVSAWWDAEDLWEQARTATRRSRWATRGALRCALRPTALVAGDGPEGAPAGAAAGASVPPRMRTGLAFADALAHVLLSAPPPNAALVYTQPATQRTVAIVIEQRDGQDEAHLWFVQRETDDQPLAEAPTVFRIVRKDGTALASTEPPRLGGRLPLAEMRGGLLITDAVRKQQDRVNFFETLIVRVGETAGFPERTIINAAPHGEWRRDTPDGPPLDTFEDEGGPWYLHPAARTIGSATTTELVGIRQTKAVTASEAEAGVQPTTVATPAIVYHEPTDPAYAVTASEHGRRTMLRQCKQPHLAVDSTAESSGVAYDQARSVFAKDCARTKGPLETMARETIACAIAHADGMTTDGDPLKGFLDDYRVVVTATVNPGPVSVQQQQQNAQAVKDRQLPRESAMAANGVEDVAAAVALIDASPEAKLALLQAQATLFATLAGATSVEAAADALAEVGMDPKVVAALKRSQGDGGGAPAITQ